MITEEELRAILGLGDIGGAEDTLKQQLALAGELRDKVGTGNGAGGIGGNIGRAGYGIASAINDARARKAAPQISAMKQKLLDDLLKRRQQATVPTSYTYGGDEA
jgi:hypothetical protein